MTNVVNEGLSVVQTTGQKMRDGLSAAASGARDEAGTVSRAVREEIDGIRQHSEHPAAHKREQRATNALMAELVTFVAGTLTAFFVSRLVRAMFRRHRD